MNKSQKEWPINQAKVTNFIADDTHKPLITIWTWTIGWSAANPEHTQLHSPFMRDVVHEGFHYGKKTKAVLKRKEQIHEKVIGDTVADMKSKLSKCEKKKGYSDRLEKKIWKKITAMKEGMERK